MCVSASQRDECFLNTDFQRLIRIDRRLRKSNLFKLLLHTQI